MAQPAPPLPSRFPCWCLATYSWGGESKNDLGFVEGDLIECLNAGDGSWWMGRLRRDRRAMGLFPSNFVKLLDENFCPKGREASPLPELNPNVSKPKSSPQKSKTFRKPFQAYVELGSRNTSPNTTVETKKPVGVYREPLPRSSRHSNSATKTQNDRSASSLPSSPSRQFSFAQTSHSPSRQISKLQHVSRPVSPHIPSLYNSRHSSPTPVPQRGTPHISNSEENLESSPPPPPPPPHRVAYTATSRAPSPSIFTNDRNAPSSRVPSPAPTTPTPYSPTTAGHTPSPLRDAMDDIMSSLDDMALHRQEHHPPREERKVVDPWSPEAFEELHIHRKKSARRRPRSSLGIASSQRGYMGEDEEDDVDLYENVGTDQWANTTDDMAPEIPRHAQQYMQPLGMVDSRPRDELFLPDGNAGPPAPPPKERDYQPRPTSSLGNGGPVLGRGLSQRKLKHRKSAYELGRSMLDRTLTTKSTTTNSSSGLQSVATNQTTSTDRTSQSLMSGQSAGGFSATSAGSLARRKWGSIRSNRPMSVIDTRHSALLRLDDGESMSDRQIPYQPSDSSSRPASRKERDELSNGDDCGSLGGLMTPRKRKSGFFKKLVETAKTGAANARGTIAAGQLEPARSPVKSLLPNGVTAIAGGSIARDMGMSNPKNEIDWVQVRRDINRSNSLSRNEKSERIERCHIMDYPVIAPEDTLYEEAEGDEDINGAPIQLPTDYQSVNLQLVDKSARFINSLPPMTNSASLAQGYVCRPHRSDVQRLRAIFTWVSEKVAWEEDFEGDVDPRRVIQMRRGCSEEVAVLVAEMCTAAGLHAEIVRGYLKTPGEVPDGTDHVRPNHWWNAVVVDGCWRIMDCSLASPTNPKRSQYSSASSQIAENGFFLARPMEICYTHIPLAYEQQHICPPIATDVLLALPCSCPPYFKHGLRMLDFDTSAMRIENLELAHVQFTVDSDIECVAEVEVRAYTHDVDGDTFESGDLTITRALAQADWVGGQKRYTIKAHLPGDEGHGTLKIYAGKRGLMHSIKDNPHPLAFALPIIHQGKNPPYEFFLRHPTPHAQRHDLYVAQPQCRRLAINNTFVFAIRQHPSSLSFNSTMDSSSISGSFRPRSPNPFARPASAMSTISSAAGSNGFFNSSDTMSQTSSQSGSSSSQQQQSQQQKPAKLAVQSPSGKILRLMRKADNSVSVAEAGDGGVWETIIKVGERGTWRALVLADRSARWCVFGEWECF